MELAEISHLHSYICCVRLVTSQKMQSTVGYTTSDGGDPKGGLTAASAMQLFLYLHGGRAEKHRLVPYLRTSLSIRGQPWPMYCGALTLRALVRTRRLWVEETLMVGDSFISTKRTSLHIVPGYAHLRYTSPNAQQQCRYITSHPCKTALLVSSGYDLNKRAQNHRATTSTSDSAVKSEFLQAAGTV